ncbi:hypothetical protein FXV83_15185 [Bradyrhizobium hipponense]|uniref:Uncharacterized protein n=1 Tax=Bradyrhizobium hipponense TaxID=2605638 RepID=A0A5S4YNQ0_9BRAD|nr:hypothetical protein [Bradyrhizobium hipponense]TYO65758.1 hypothetical protein FXV83_15185 [Bradyrhizobium hipponense]
MTATENLIAAIGPWLDEAKLHMDQERVDAYVACLQADGADVQIVIRLREGTISLDGTHDGQPLDLYRQEVRPPEALNWIFGAHRSKDEQLP